jgi:hypothetical protein
MSSDKQHLGDGVYADFDGYQIVLTTEDGVRTTNTIYLENAVFSALLRYVERLKAKYEQERSEQR